MNSNIKAVAFKNGCNDVVANLYLPNDFTETTTYAALVLATPGSSVKEQIGAVYAGKLVASGFVVLVFDPSYQGESGGEPRDLEDPYVRVEDLRCAVDFLMTLPYVGEERVGILGICAGGGYAVNAALTEHRFKAVGTVVAGNIGRAFRQMQPKAELLETLETVGKQRTSEARGSAPRRDPWIPDSLKDAGEAGITDPDLLDAVRFYRESAFRHDNSTNRLYFRSLGLMIGFDAFHLVPELLTQPVQVIVGGRRGTTGSFEDGQTLFDLAPNPGKNFFVVEGAGHYDMYYKPEYVDQAIARLVPFYREHLAE
jgi:fermentation-respiration switch protein FrsA (DUF1100 family)